MEEVPAIAEARFPCAACGAEAGFMQLVLSDPGHELKRTSFTSITGMRVSKGDVEKITKLLAELDARALHRYDWELMSFYCLECDAVYCREHYSPVDIFDEDGWHDSIRGHCPKGHVRMLED